MAIYYHWRKYRPTRVAGYGFDHSYNSYPRKFYRSIKEYPYSNADDIEIIRNASNTGFCWDCSTGFEEFEADADGVSMSNRIWFICEDMYPDELFHDGKAIYDPSLDRPYKTENAAVLSINENEEDIYSTDENAEIKNDWIGRSYYYFAPTPVESPLAPASITYPAPIVTPYINLQWSAASSRTNYPVSSYEVSYKANGGNDWVIAGTTTETSLQFTIPDDCTSIQFRVRAEDSNGQWGEYQTGTLSAVNNRSKITVPSLAMHGQQITVKWTDVVGAISYTLQRKSSADADWVQVYSGANLTYSEMAGTWSTVQYRVQPVFTGAQGAWATSASIPVISESSLVISGTDGDLGTLVNDVPYTISTDTGNQITVKTTVNGAVIFDSTVPSGAAEFIPVLDLVHGTGTIVIEASVQASSGTVSAVRSWTYNKAAMTFPNAGCPSQLERNGKNIWPMTLAECVRLPGGRTLEEVTRFPAQAFYTSYTGTGTSGSGNQTHLAVPFKPQALAILDGNTGDAVLMVRPGTKVMNGNTSLTVAWSDTGVSWYSTNASNQLNATGTAYHVVVFG